MPAPSGFTTVSATNLLSGGVPVALATISFQTVTNSGMPIPVLIGSNAGLEAGEAYTATVTNGAFTINLPDTAIGEPANFGYNVTLHDQLTNKPLLLQGYGCFQPSGASVAFDAVAPNLAAQVTVQRGPTGIGANYVPSAGAISTVGGVRHFVFDFSGSNPCSVISIQIQDGEFITPDRMTFTGMYDGMPLEIRLTFLSNHCGITLPTASGGVYFADGITSYSAAAGTSVSSGTVLVNPWQWVGFAFFSVGGVFDTPDAVTSGELNAAISAATLPLKTLAELRDLSGATNVFNPANAVQGSIIDYATGAQASVSGAMATGLIPANTGGPMVFSVSIPATTSGGGAPDPVASSTANLLPPSGYQNDVLINASTGVVESHSNYYETPKFLVTPGSTYTTNINMCGGPWGPVFFDANGTFVSGIISITPPTSGGQVSAPVTFTVPSTSTIKYCSFGLNGYGGGTYTGSPCSISSVTLGSTISQCVAWAAVAQTGTVSTNGLARYDKNGLYLRGTEGPIAAGTVLTIANDEAFVKAGFASDVSGSLMVTYSTSVPSTYQGFGTLPPNVIEAMIAAGGSSAPPVTLATTWPAMAGLDYWLTFTDNNGSTVSDSSGNNKTGVIGGSTATPASWLGSVGIKLGTQTVTVANANGRPTNGFCAYFTSASDWPTFGGTAASGQASFVLQGSYGVGYDHGATCLFPEYGQSNGGGAATAIEGLSGVHCIELVAGTSGGRDVIVIDGKEALYVYNNGVGGQWVGGAQLTNAIVAQGGTIYSMWAAPAADTVAKACERTASEMARLSSLGVVLGLPKPTAKTDNIISITGTSIDQGFQASATPASRLALPFTATIYNMSISGQDAKCMDAGYLDRESTKYNHRAEFNVAYHGGVTNSLTNYLQSPQNALLDVLSWNRQAKAQGYKTVVSTMLSRSGNYVTNGQSTSYTGDQLAQAFNALLLAVGDEFTIVANMAADPVLGATGACNSTTYFADGTHPNDTGQTHYLAIFQAGLLAANANPLTVVSGNYTQIDSDRLIVQTAGTASTLTLKNAIYQSFNKEGILSIKNTGSATMTVTAVSGQTIDGQSTATVGANGILKLRPFVAVAANGGANWISI